MLSKSEERILIEAIERAESLSRAELRVHYTTKKSVAQIIDAAKAQFERLGMHQTEERNGILIYIAPLARQLAILGDEGIHKHVGQLFWEETHRSCIESIQRDGLASGLVHAIETIGQEMARYFPIGDRNPNELSNDISHD
ncbi:MAG: TPM domain-containing protein [Bacteroidia bacterium]